ncbi:MAG: methyl-accepting chemotaxis protein [Cyanobacteria bacterium J06623_7]
MTNSAHYSDPELTPAETASNSVNLSWWQRQSIRFKTTAIAIAIGAIPTLLVGTVAYYFAADSIEQQTSSARKTIVGELQNQVNVFMGDRLNDIKVMANLDIFTHPQLSQQASKAEKAAALEQIQTVYGFYNSIAVFDLQGNVIAQTKGKALGNHLNRGYIQAALTADSAVLSQPRISTSSGIFSVYSAAPIKDKVSGQTIGFVRARIPVKALNKLLQNYTTESDRYYLLDNKGQVFLSSAGEYVVKIRSDGSSATDSSFKYEAVTAESIFANVGNLLRSDSLATDIALDSKTDLPQFLAYAPAQAKAGLPKLSWRAILATETAVVYAPQRKLALVFAIGSAVMAIGVGAIVYALVNRCLRPILAAADAVREIGRGNFNPRLNIIGTDEIAQLGSNIDSMATQLADFVQVQTILARQSTGIKNIALELAKCRDLQSILTKAVEGCYQTFKAERIVYYRLDEETALAVAESVASGQTAIINTSLSPQLNAEYQAQTSPEVEVIGNLDQAGISVAQQEYCQSLGVKSCLIAPVMFEERLTGLLMVQQMFTPIPWLDEEVEFITQVATQINFALTRLQLAEQQKQAEIKEKSAKEAIQMRAYSLLQEVYEVSAGDLTIRARVTEDEIGTIADSYNSTIESLRDLVNQTKAAANEVQLNTAANDAAVSSLATEAMAQAEAIAQMLERVKEMENSILMVADRAHQAEEFVRQATSTIDQEDLAMNHTVAEIKAVQHTVTQTAIKAEKLGESSQEISQAVNLIGRFAAQTHLLALKASIEAARAGEQGKGFAVIADEVRSLATQSAEATAEIETLVNKIQLETAEVVQAMNQGAVQIASGNELVQQTRSSLTEIERVSNEVSQLVSSITQTTQQQSVTSAEVSQSIIDIAAIAKHNSQSANQVSTSIGELATVASKLQSSIAKFKT